MGCRLDSKSSGTLYFMTEDALKWIDKSDGWEIGVGPTIVVVDMGAAGSLTSTTAQSDIYAFFFDQKGLMAGLGLQGTKITKLNKALRLSEPAKRPPEAPSKEPL